MEKYFYAVQLRRYKGYIYWGGLGTIPGVRIFHQIFRSKPLKVNQWRIVNGRVAICEIFKTLEYSIILIGKIEGNGLSVVQSFVMKDMDCLSANVFRGQFSASYVYNQYKYVTKKQFETEFGNRKRDYAGFHFFPIAKGYREEMLKNSLINDQPAKEASPKLTLA